MEKALTMEADWVWLMDSDGLAKHDTLEQFLLRARDYAESRVGIVVPKTYSRIRGKQWETTKAYRRGFLGREIPVRHCSEPTDAHYAGGNGLFINAACIRDIGGYDSRFFFGYDDTEYTIRAYRHGWRIVHDPNIVVSHPAQWAKGRAWRIKAVLVSLLPPYFRDLRKEDERYNVRVRPAVLRFKFGLTQTQFCIALAYSFVILAIRRVIDHRIDFRGTLRAWREAWRQPV
jgi:GT2 family glycosyltransferase